MVLFSKRNIELFQWEDLALRPECRGIIKRRVHEFEEQHNAEFDAKHDEIKARPLSISNYYYVGGIVTCPQRARVRVRREAWSH